MSTMQALVDDFLSQKRIAVAGLSRTQANPANLIYRKLKDTGHTVYAVNPNAETIEGDPCYPDLQSIPEKVDGVMIVTKPDQTDALVHQAKDAGIPRVWMHCSLIHGGSSISKEAVEFCKTNHISVIEGGCPMMSQEPVDFAHKCMHWIMQNITHQLPKG